MGDTHTVTAEWKGEVVGWKYISETSSTVQAERTVFVSNDGSAQEESMRFTNFGIVCSQSCFERHCYFYHFTVMMNCRFGIAFLEHMEHGTVLVESGGDKSRESVCSGNFFELV